MTPAEGTMPSWDGAELFYRSWIPEKPTNKALLLFHRGHEHSGRWQELVDLLALEDVAMFAWDARGHGRSHGRTWWRGEFRRHHQRCGGVRAPHFRTQHEIALENVIVLAHSVGAVSVAAWVHDYAPPIRAMVLATAAFRVRLYVPLALPALRLKQKFLGPGHVKSYVKSRMLTHDREQAARYDADPLIFRQIAVNVLIDLHETGRATARRCGRHQRPDADDRRRLGLGREPGGAARVLQRPLIAR